MKSKLNKEVSDPVSFKQCMEECQQLKQKLTAEITASKKKKFERDASDYERGRVYPWRNLKLAATEDDPSDQRNNKEDTTTTRAITPFRGGRTFMIHNSQCSLCLEDSADTGEVLLKKCNLDSVSQQWLWINQGMLMCVASSRCLSSQSEPVQTRSCHGPDVDAAGLMWDCDSDRLISRNASLLLSVSHQRLILTKHSKHSKWRSLDEGDVCQERLRLRRASGDSDQAEYEDEPAEGLAAMTEEQREYLRWYYRTEDPTTWRFVLLGLAFICLLIGFLLLGMGAMANKSRKKIAKYKAAASFINKNENEALQINSPLRDNGASPQHGGVLQGHMSSMDTSELKAGDIVVTWKDGNTSCLYSDRVEEDKQEEEQEETEEKEVPDAEQETHDGVTMTE
ncbi:uncharacterized protein LOC142383029 [Odontesthes bonariensis]|uniref:uncharacterized protein LOC142383029 n=1 Tax=Odontesthes bonariensis TaxID=219752 RepID=UPI003F58BDAA